MGRKRLSRREGLRRDKTDLGRGDVVVKDSCEDVGGVSGGCVSGVWRFGGLSSSDGLLLLEAALMG